MTDESYTPKEEATSGSEARRTEQPAPRRSRSRSRSRAKAKRNRRWLQVTLVVLLLVAAVAGAFFAYRWATARKAASADLDKAITLVERADATVIEVDEVIRAEVESSLATRAAEALRDLPDAVTDLEDAIELAEGASPDLPSDRVEEADALIASAQARLTMLEHAEVILNANVKAASAIDPANEGWDRILAAEKTADQAVAEYNKLTTEAVKRSRELTEKATGEITSGKSKLEQAQDAFPEADFSPFIKYADGKLAALEISKKADDAFLADKKEEANKLNEQYNAAEKKLVEQAKGLPSSPNAVIAEAYESLAGSATVEYFDAREEATVADAELLKVSGSEEE